MSNLGRIPSIRRLLALGLGLLLLAAATTMLNKPSWVHGGASLIWLPNGLLIGVLLCTPRRQWPAFLALGYATDFCTNLLLHFSLGASVIFGVGNLVEVFVAATLMAPTIAANPDLTEARQLRSFLLYGVGLAPAITSLLDSAAFHLHSSHPIKSLTIWCAADTLGNAMIVPLYISLHQRTSFSRRSRLEVAGLFLLLCSVCLVAFGVTTYPLLWLPLLCLLLLGVRLGFAGSALGLLTVTFLGGYLSLTGHGPLRVTPESSLFSRILLFQAFIALSMIALYVTEVAMCNSRRFRQKLEASELRFRLLTETSRDVIVLAGHDGTREYVSPAITEMLGWQQDELIGQPMMQIVHPDDAEAVRELFAHVLSEKPTVPGAYRCLGKDGTYLWVEASVRLLRDAATHRPQGFVYTMRDISDRKAAEESMREARDVAERLATMDGLTGIPNRRLLDQTLNHEWVLAHREQTPLTVLLIDVDHFKSYNDLYGHLAGDECLRRVAMEMQLLMRRPQDLLARYGGEEFAAVLPNTSRQGAELVAERLRRAVEGCGVAHAGNTHGIVTVSLGCATGMPAHDVSLGTLMKSADEALYRAKSNGRNQLQVFEGEFMLPVERLAPPGPESAAVSPGECRIALR